MTNADIQSLLAEHGLGTAEIQGVEGGSILAASAGARVLRLVGSSGQDFLWLHNAFCGGDPNSLFQSPGWRNFGGDRTWIAPESELFIGDLKDPWNTYSMPEAFDPGSYKISSSDGSIRIAGGFRVKNHRLKKEAELSLEKTVAAAPNPFRHLGHANDLREAEYVGYDQVTTLTLLSDPSPGLRFGIWQLAQVRATGDVLIPVTRTQQPRDYFARTQEDRVTLEPGLIRFRIDAAALQKIGVKAAVLMGRVGFIRDCGDGKWSLLVRNFHVNPSAEYIDVPWDDLEDKGYALQCCNDDGKWADFGEFEYHTPAIGDGTGMASYTDRGQLWAFRAEKPLIQQIAGCLLGSAAREKA